MAMQLHCVIEKGKRSFPHSVLADAVFVPVSQGTEVTLVTKYDIFDRPLLV